VPPVRRAAIYVTAEQRRRQEWIDPKHDRPRPPWGEGGLLEAKCGADELDTLGIQVKTTIDSRLQALARWSLERGLEEVDQRHGLRSTRAPTIPGKILLTVLVGDRTGVVDMTAEPPTTREPSSRWPSAFIPATSCACAWSPSAFACAWPWMR
jgi:hypothetical protein